MRPRQIRRGVRTAGIAWVVAYRASMRPRQIRRGVWRGSDGLRGGRADASMRPRQIRRGVVSLMVHLPCLYGGFNEAPADSPGSDRKRRSISNAIRLASMRPRQIRRGVARPSSGRRDTACGGFNEAPADSPGSGHQAFDVGACREVPASMRPRQIRRGVVDDLLRDVELRPASMRPRQIRRGVRPCGRTRSRRAAGFNEAPADSPGSGAELARPSTRSGALQ